MYTNLAMVIVSGAVLKAPPLLVHGSLWLVHRAQTQLYTCTFYYIVQQCQNDLHLYCWCSFFPKLYYSLSVFWGSGSSFYFQMLWFRPEYRGFHRDCQRLSRASQMMVLTLRASKRIEHMQTQQVWWGKGLNTQGLSHKVAQKSKTKANNIQLHVCSWVKHNWHRSVFDPVKWGSKSKLLCSLIKQSLFTRHHYSSCRRVKGKPTMNDCSLPSSICMKTQSWTVLCSASKILTTLLFSWATCNMFLGFVTEVLLYPHKPKSHQPFWTWGLLHNHQVIQRATLFKYASKDLI